MNSRTSRIVLIILGVIALGTGAVWVGQGLNLIPGSVMTGSSFWLVVGLVVGVIGAVLLVVGLRRSRDPR